MVFFVKTPRADHEQYYLSSSNKNKEEKKRSLVNLGRSTLIPLILFLCSTLVFLLIFFYPPKHPSNYIPTQPAASSFHQHDEESCDLGDGRWVRDTNYGPLYTNMSCATMSDSKNCMKNGRTNKEFLSWKWRPDGCELPRFDPKAFLQIVRGKKMAFIGDSVARNHIESLVCLLSKEESPVDVDKDSEDRFRTWHFTDYDFTLMILWSRFLVVGEEKIVNGSGSGTFDLHLDQIDQKWAQVVPGLDYAIISDGHWFFRKLYLYKKGVMIGCVYCDDPNVNKSGPEFALRMSFRAALSYINNCKDCERVMTIIRTFAPAHFENGTWNNGGSCNRVRPQDESEIEMASYHLSLGKIQVEEIERSNEMRVNDNTRVKKSIEVLDVTRPMIMRPDGHPGAHWGNKWMKGYNDCVHWCLPGPIDVWNDFLLAAMLRKSSKKFY